MLLSLINSKKVIRRTIRKTFEFDLLRLNNITFQIYYHTIALLFSFFVFETKKTPPTLNNPYL